MPHKIVKPNDSVSTWLGKSHTDSQRLRRIGRKFFTSCVIASETSLISRKRSKGLVIKFLT